MRSGFDPIKISQSETSDFAIGDDDEAADADDAEEESDETRRWKENGNQGNRSDNPKSDYGTLDEGHVWNVNDGDDV